jgi:glycosyltransferase involved in cell wall biosynthesis
MPPLITIVVPNYNQATFLTECLISIKNQTYKEWQCIIYDDGSTDTSVELIRRIIQNDSRFMLIAAQKNKGLSTARNIGIIQAKSRWILPLDSDDFISPNFLEEGSRAIRQNSQLRLVVPSTQMFGTENRLIKTTRLTDEDILVNLVLPHCCIYRKEDFEMIGGYDPRLVFSFEDTEFWISLWYECGLSNENVAFITTITFFYRRRNDAKSLVTLRDEFKMKYTRQVVLQKHRAIFERFPHALAIMES